MTLHRHRRLRLRVLAFGLFALLAIVGFGTSAAPAQDAPDPQQSKLVDALSNLNATKLNALLTKIGVQPSPEFFDCMCPPGYHYYPAPGIEPCRYVGPLGGITTTGYIVALMESCAAAHPLPDGRSVLGAIAAAAGKPPKPSCPRTPTVAGFARDASYFAYAPWPPPMFNGVSPEHIIYNFTESERDAAKLLGDRFAAIGNGVITALGEVLDIPAKAKDLGYDIIVNHERDLRLDVSAGNGGAEFAFKPNAQTGKWELSELLFKYASPGSPANVEIGIGAEHGRWDGKLKFGLSFERKGGVQVEGKFGLEFDTNAVPILSLDDEPSASRSYFDAIKWPLEVLLEGLNPYIGTAFGPQGEAPGGPVALGPEFTKVFRDPTIINRLYSEWVFDDMYKALDLMLVQQKAVEDARHARIRAMATAFGIENADCLTIGEATKAIRDKIIADATEWGIPTEGRTIREIRADLSAKVAAGKPK